MEQGWRKVSQKSYFVCLSASYTGLLSSPRKWTIFLPVHYTSVKYSGTDMKKLGRHTVEAEGFYVFEGYLFIYFTFFKKDSLPECLSTWLVFI